MLALIKRYVHDPMDAEDILHDGFIIAFTRLKTLRDYDHVDSWLAIIMKNLSLQFLHNQDIGTVLHEIPETEDTPDFDEFIDMEALESLIKRLPAGYQNVFRLSVFENKSHKEIAKILGISPNTSSSQLFRARMMMQRLIKEYRAQTGALILLLVAIPLALYLIPSDSLTTAGENDIAENPVDIVAVKSVSESASCPVAMQTASFPSPVVVDNTLITKSTSKSNLLRINMVKEDTDSISAQQTVMENPEVDKNDATKNEYNRSSEVTDNRVDETNADSYVDNSLSYVKKKSASSGWSVGLDVNPGIANFNGEQGDNDMFAGDSPGGGDCFDPGDTPSEGVAFGNYKYVSHNNSVPISVSLLISRNITKKLSLESGLTYTYLHTEFNSKKSTADCHWHYLGIPLRIKFRFISSGRFNIYASAGGKFDLPLYSNSVVSTVEGTPDLDSGRFSSSAVWSLSAGLGAAIKLSGHFEIFLEPTLIYKFQHNYKVPNIWTDNPFGFSLPIGLRFNM